MQNLFIDREDSIDMSLRTKFVKKLCVLYVFCALIIGLAIGLCLTYVAMKDRHISCLITSSPFAEDIRKSLFNSIDSQRISSNLKFIIKKVFDFEIS